MSGVYGLAGSVATLHNDDQRWVMVSQEALLSLKETALLSEVSEKFIRHALEDEIPSVRGAPSGSNARWFRIRDVFYFRLLSKVPVGIPKEDRKSLHSLICKRMTVAGPWEVDRADIVLKGDGITATLHVKEMKANVAHQTRLYFRGRRRVERRDDVLGGEPVFAGTRISIRHVGALVKKGASVADLLGEFPRLTEDDLHFAELFVGLGNPPGRPKKSLKFRRRNG